MPLQQAWSYFNLTEKNILNQKFEIFDSNKPKQYYLESIAFRMHSFCYKYLTSKYPNFSISNQRNDIEKIIWSEYINQANSIKNDKPAFKCLSNINTLDKRIEVRFDLNVDYGFQPFEWDIFNKNQLTEIYLDEYRIGSMSSHTKFEPNQSNCIIFKESDTNRNGLTDIWYKYQNCKLISHDEDFNENGNIERSCSYNENSEIGSCVGLGEKNLQLGLEAELKEDYNKAIYYFELVNQEYDYEFKGYSRHTCDPQFKILKFHYNLMDYSSLNDEFLKLKSNPYCKKQVIDSQIYIGFINLYSLKRYEEGVEQLEASNKSYKEERGWDSIEINFALSFGYLNLQRYESCLESLKKVAGRPFNSRGRYFYNYYFGSCQLGLKHFPEAKAALLIAKDSSNDDLEKSMVFYKLGIWHAESGLQSSEQESYFQKAVQLNPNLAMGIEIQRKKYLQVTPIQKP
jgi:hypothetical protein